MHGTPEQLRISCVSEDTSCTQAEKRWKKPPWTVMGNTATECWNLQMVWQFPAVGIAVLVLIRFTLLMSTSAHLIYEDTFRIITKPFTSIFINQSQLVSIGERLNSCCTMIFSGSTIKDQDPVCFVCSPVKLSIKYSQLISSSRHASFAFEQFCCTSRKQYHSYASGHFIDCILSC